MFMLSDHACSPNGSICYFDTDIPISIIEAMKRVLLSTFGLDVIGKVAQISL